ncbi:receptor-like protein kinase THESEUS 1 [Senna tora]|uniref:Receptor-like protein kinase THESEUS 1 n=1 Tax=Senna tora TaxID=362788 RepID=A0A834WUU8_9FABA|nr:receptor-like protein kinase THESEUS 1 [Senna tora]
MDIEKVKWMFALRASDSGIIACGSSQNITFAGRTFIADSQHSTVRFQSQSSVIATINSSNISPVAMDPPSMVRVFAVDESV